MKAILFAVLVVLGATACNQDGQYTMIAHEDMTDTLQVTVNFTDYGDIVVDSGGTIWKKVGANGYKDIQRLTLYKKRDIDNGFLLMGTDNDDVFVFTLNKVR